MVNRVFAQFRELVVNNEPALVAAEWLLPALARADILLPQDILLTGNGVPGLPEWLAGGKEPARISELGLPGLEMTGRIHRRACLGRTLARMDIADPEPAAVHVTEGHEIPVRRMAVATLQEIVDQCLPVQPDRLVIPLAEFELGEPGAVMAILHLQPRCLLGERASRRIRTHEDQAARQPDPHPRQARAPGADTHCGSRISGRPAT